MTIKTNSNRKSNIVTLTGMLFLKNADGTPVYRAKSSNKNQAVFSVGNTAKITSGDKTKSVTSGYTRYDVWLSDEMIDELADMEITHGCVVKIEGGTMTKEEVLAAKGDKPERKITKHIMFPNKYELVKKAEFVPEQPETSEDIPF